MHFRFLRFSTPISEMDDRRNEPNFVLGHSGVIRWFPIFDNLVSRKWFVVE